MPVLTLPLLSSLPGGAHVECGPGWARVTVMRGRIQGFGETVFDATEDAHRRLAWWSWRQELPATVVTEGGT